MDRPSVAVLMATHNGSQFLIEQIESLSRQEDVKLALFVSDDFSTDGTLDIVNDFCRRLEVDCTILPQNEKFGGAAKNFFRLIGNVEANGFDYFAFADQDDIWHPNKLSKGISALGMDADGASSNVTAFWTDGRAKLLLKSQSQRQYDHLFGSPGPGCTFLLTSCLFKELQRLVRANTNAFERCELHDWAIYAVARSLGYRWRILSEPTMHYRQHATNVFGARYGLTAWRKRLDLIRQGWMYHQVISTMNLIETCCPNIDLSVIKQPLLQPNLRNRLKLCLHAREARRALLDQCLLGFLFATGLFWPKNVGQQLHER